jgi:hypothetical protein
MSDGLLVQSAYEIIDGSAFVAAGATRQLGTSATNPFGEKLVLGVDEIRGILSINEAAATGTITVYMQGKEIAFGGATATHTFPVAGGPANGVDFTVKVTGKVCRIEFTETSGGSPATIFFSVFAWPRG